MPEIPGEQVAAGAVIMTVINAILGLKLFARPEDLDKVRTHIAENYVSKTDMKERFDGMDKRLDKMDEKLDILIGGRRHER